MQQTKKFKKRTNKHKKTKKQKSEETQETNKKRKFFRSEYTSEQLNIAGGTIDTGY